MARRLLDRSIVMGWAEDRCGRRSTACAALAVLAGVAGCGAIEPTPSTFTDPISARESAPHATSATALVAAGYPAVRCAHPAALLVHHDSAGHVDRVHATLTARGLSGPYLVDTGSLASFTTNVDAEEAKSAETTLACTETTLPIIGRLLPGSTPDGTPQAGVLGADLVAHGAFLDLDLKMA